VKSLSVNPCRQFGDSAERHSIRIPFSGIYRLTTQIGWKSPSYPAPNSTFAVKVALGLRQNESDDPATHTQVAYNQVTVNCAPSNPLCGIARIHQSLRLKEGDRLYISVKYKDLVESNQANTFLELKG
jgi:hypothetical protein